MRRRGVRVALLCLILLAAACARVRTEGNAIEVSGPLPDPSGALVGGDALDAADLAGLGPLLVERLGEWDARKVASESVVSFLVRALPAD